MDRSSSDRDRRSRRILHCALDVSGAVEVNAPLPDAVGVVERMYDAAEQTPWDVNDHGLWCPSCGWLAAPPWFFDDEDFTPPESCRECGYPHG